MFMHFLGRTCHTHTHTVALLVSLEVGSSERSSAGYWGAHPIIIAITSPSPRLWSPQLSWWLWSHHDKILVIIGQNFKPSGPLVDHFYRNVDPFLVKHRIMVGGSPDIARSSRRSPSALPHLIAALGLHRRCRFGRMFFHHWWLSNP